MLTIQIEGRIIRIFLARSDPRNGADENLVIGELEKHLLAAERQAEYVAERASAAGSLPAAALAGDLESLEASIRAVQRESALLRNSLSFTRDFVAEVSASFAPVAPVLLVDCMLQSAMRQVGAECGAVGLKRGKELEWVVSKGVEEDGIQVRTVAVRRALAGASGDALAVVWPCVGVGSSSAARPGERSAAHVLLALRAAGGRPVLLLLGRPSRPFTKDEVDALPRTLELSRSLAEAAVRGLEDARAARERPMAAPTRRFPQFVGNSPKLLAILDVVARIAPTDVSLLIEGESGTGKEMIARAVYEASNRSHGPFMVVNCGALPESLLDSELFGYERGAFSGATEPRAGIFEAADGGTIFLDEISEMSSGLQVKLLRVIQAGEVRRLGSNLTRRVNVRVIAATNMVLLDLVERGLFREDLYYRLNVVRVQLPPLRERREDISLLLEHFLACYAQELGRSELRFSQEALQLMLDHDYPGNVRELQNMVQRAVVLCRTNTIGVNDLPEEVRAAVMSRQGVPTTNLELKTAKARARRKISDQIERLFLVHALKQARGNVSKAARQTSMNRSLFKQMVGKHQLDIRSFN